ncbi:MAG: hypothetical protein HZB67_00675, partial [Candidatus Aenigmarchaeota archaeon]|nr:hypothetical protein [Candidatus Aenigmarchaeota archaeon]
MDCRHRSLILLVVLSGFLFSIAFASIAYAEANVTDPCAGITCNPSSLTCPDGFAATCTNTCSAGTCSSCSPDCSGHQIVDKCAGVICNVVTLTCIDKFVASCTPKCDSATGQCGTCTPDCSGHQGSNSTAVCNNWVREEIEQCDGNDLAGQTCQSRGFVGGTLKCNMGCTFDTGGCTSATAVCGNGVCE